MHRMRVGTDVLTQVQGIHMRSMGKESKHAGPEQAHMCLLLSWASVRCPRGGRENVQDRSGH